MKNQKFVIRTRFLRKKFFSKAYKHTYGKPQLVFS